MKKYLFGIVFILMTLFVLPQTATVFNINNVSIVETVSHDRVYITVDPLGAWFPYSGQVGWRIYFSRWFIGWDDPQYEYTVWILPARGFDLSPSFWFVRPKGLEGEWHYRIDAVDSSRKPLATSNEQIYTFGGEGATVYTGAIPWVAQDNLWFTSYTFTNTGTTAVNVTMKFYEQNGDPFSVIHGTNVYNFNVQPKAAASFYTSQVIGYQYVFYGHVELESDKPIDYMTFITDGERFLTFTGSLK